MKGWFHAGRVIVTRAPGKQVKSELSFEVGRGVVKWKGWENHPATWEQQEQGERLGHGAIIDAKDDCPLGSKGVVGDKARREAFTSW